MDHLEEAVEIVHTGPQPGPNARRSWLRRRVWNALMLLCRPYARYQDRVNVTVVSAVGDVTHGNRQLARALAHVDERVRRLEHHGLASDSQGENHLSDGDVWLETRKLEGFGTVRGFFGVREKTEQSLSWGVNEPSVLDQRYVDILRHHEPSMVWGVGTDGLSRALALAGVDSVAFSLDGAVADGYRLSSTKARMSAPDRESIEAIRPSTIQSVAIRGIDRLHPADVEWSLDQALRLLAPGGLLLIECTFADATRGLSDVETIVGAAVDTGFATAFAFCPLGTGDFDRDIRDARTASVLATAP